MYMYMYIYIYIERERESCNLLLFPCNKISPRNITPGGKWYKGKLFRMMTIV